MFSLSWKNVQPSLFATYQNNLLESEYADVTLVSDDNTTVAAHKLVLCACSPVFRNILYNSPDTNTVIHFGGVKTQDLVSAVKFMYLGESNVHEDHIRNVMDILKALQINNYSTDTIQDDIKSFDPNTNEESLPKNEIASDDDVVEGFVPNVGEHQPGKDVSVLLSQNDIKT